MGAIIGFVIGISVIVFIIAFVLALLIWLWEKLVEFIAWLVPVITVLSSYAMAGFDRVLGTCEIIPPWGSWIVMGLFIGTLFSFAICETHYLRRRGIKTQMVLLAAFLTLAPAFKKMDMEKIIGSLSILVNGKSTAPLEEVTEGKKNGNSKKGGTAAPPMKVAGDRPEAPLPAEPLGAEIPGIYFNAEGPQDYIEILANGMAFKKGEAYRMVRKGSLLHMTGKGGYNVHKFKPVKGALIKDHDKKYSIVYKKWKGGGGLMGFARKHSLWVWVGINQEAAGFVVRENGSVSYRNRSLGRLRSTENSLFVSPLSPSKRYRLIIDCDILYRGGESVHVVPVSGGRIFGSGRTGYSIYPDYSWSPGERFVIIQLGWQGNYKLLRIDTQTKKSIKIKFKDFTYNREFEELQIQELDDLQWINGTLFSIDIKLVCWQCGPKEGGLAIIPARVNAETLEITYEKAVIKRKKRNSS